jgi:RecA-family ATPase
LTADLTTPDVRAPSEALPFVDEPLGERPAGAEGSQLEPSTGDLLVADPFDGRWVSARDLRCFDVSARPAPRRWLLMREPEGERETNRIDPEGEAEAIGYLPMGKVGMVVAAGGLGKTMALCQLAIAVATRRRWLARRDGGRDVGGFLVPPGAAGRVLLALAEEDAEEAHRRLYDGAYAVGLTREERELAADRIDVLPLAGVAVAFTAGDGAGNTKPTLVLEALRARLEHRAAQAGAEWRLIVLDPLSRFAGNDTEKDNAAATRFVQAVETLARASGGPTVLLAHHVSKAARAGEADGANAARGASGLTDGVRWVANLEQAKDGRSLSLALAKSNYSPPARPVVLLRGERGALRAASEDERSQLESERAEGAAGKGARAASGNGKGNVASMRAAGAGGWDD